MKKIIIGSLIAAITAISVNATAVQAGWNLLGAGSSDVNLSTTYGSNPDIKVVWGFENDTKTWIGYSGDAGINQVLINSGLGGLEFVPEGMGYWVLSDSTLISDENTTTADNIITSAASTLSFGTMINGISIDNQDKWYGVVSITATSFTSMDYDYNGLNFEYEQTHNATFTKNSDQNGSIFSSEDGFGADIIINKTEQVTEINGNTYNDLYVSDIEFHVTASGSGWSDIWDWAPTYWDDTNHLDINVTTNDQLLEMFLTQNNWFSDNYAMLDGNSSAGQGNVVEGRFVSNCDSNNDGNVDSDCVIAERTSTVIGDWTYSANGISINLPNETKILSLILDSDSPTGYYIKSEGYDEVGAIWNEQMFTGSDATETLIKSLLIN